MPAGFESQIGVCNSGHEVDYTKTQGNEFPLCTAHFFFQADEVETRRKYCYFNFFQKQVTFVDRNIISTNALSMFLLHHHLNGLENENLRSVQEVMHASELYVGKSKNFCENFPNLAILTKSSTPGEIQLTFRHATVGNNSLREPVVAFALAGNLSLPSVI